MHALGSGLVIDCQADLLSDLNTRFVVPLIPFDGAPRPARRFNPVFRIGDRDYAMETQFAGSVEKRELGSIVASLKEYSFEITAALDVLISGV
ncbi:MAG TPA: CcdB family protein [Sphingomicrobium sp.]|nr:CcdB family protein [Sphingomicrobium sp.]